MLQLNKEQKIELLRIYVKGKVLSGELSFIRAERTKNRPKYDRKKVLEEYETLKKLRDEQPFMFHAPAKRTPTEVILNSSQKAQIKAALKKGKLDMAGFDWLPLEKENKYLSCSEYFNLIDEHLKD